jgi:hypothetical protein
MSSLGQRETVGEAELDTVLPRLDERQRRGGRAGVGIEHVHTFDDARP